MLLYHHESLTGLFTVRSHVGHSSHLAAFCAVFWMCARGGWSGLQVTGRPLSARIVAKSSDGIEEDAAVPKGRNPKLFQVLSR
jgi:hypothetical protein